MKPRPDRWLASLAERPGDPFWIEATRTVTRGELAGLVDDFASRVRAAGWQAGDRLAVEPHACLDTVVLVLAALRAELSVLLLPLREPATIQDKLVADAGARRSWPEGPAAFAAVRWPGALWVRSSGSLGRPRWIVHTTASLIAGATAVAQRLAFGPGARWRVSLPLDHVGGVSLIFRALAGGGALAAGDGVTLPGETHRSLVATQLRRLLAGGHASELHPLQCLLLGGGPLAKALRRESLAVGLPLVVSYGLSETAAAVATSALDEEPASLCRADYAGRALWPDAVTVDASGGIQVGGPSLCAAIAGDDGVASPLDLVDGRLSTGDLGRLDGDELYVAGRRDNVMISGGEKLGSEELEAALSELEGVEDVIVVPVEDAEYGQRPVAFVRWAAGCARSAATVREELAGRIAGWKLPVAVWELPGGPGLKADRSALRALAARLSGERR
ncbi:MAG TPA: AMP-binding protein [Candidatus Krumholzibacteria bacterium]|nr:AMP-binding protein [Candidatus Krumholzibacteria bacterium]HPD70299.1 AMP-binding protein [Candidatus Krumholzibacteria bacterium]HRY40001.1 AMP-binding protein [Candidatus Krumholzibacteria bacterium]